MTIHACSMGNFWGADLDIPKISNPEKHFTNGNHCVLW